MMRVVRDNSWRDLDDDLVLAGSPLRLLHLTGRGHEVVARAEAGLEAPTPVEMRLLDRLVSAGAVHPVDGESPFTVQDVTVVMPVRGAWPTIPSAARVVIVDDASVEPLVAPHGSPAEIVRLDSNVGPGPARSAGLARVETALVAFVDADVELPTHWLDGLLGHFADPRVAAVAPRVASLPGTSVLAEYESAHSPLDLGPDPALVAPGAKISYVPTAVLVVRVDALGLVGGFDPDLRFGEDVDLVWRLAGAGWRVRYEPGVVVHHKPRDSWRAWCHQRVGYGTSAAPLAARHGAAVAPVRCSGWSLAVWTLALTGRRRSLAAALALAAATGIALRRRLPQVAARETRRLVARGHLLAGRQIAQATRRCWWPLALLALLLGRRMRLAIGLLTILPAVADVRSATAERGARRALREAAIGVADDVAYGCGVWKGVIAARSGQALRPVLSAWPSRGGD